MLGSSQQLRGIRARAEPCDEKEKRRLVRPHRRLLAAPSLGVGRSSKVTGARSPSRSRGRPSWHPDDSPERGRRADPFQGDAGDPDDG